MKRFAVLGAGMAVEVAALPAEKLEWDALSYLQMLSQLVY